MRLISLEISNFRIIKQAKIDFTDQVIGISGINGAGKTTIIEAIAWALFGNPVARSSKDEIKSTFAGASEDCQVRLIFKIRGIIYEIKRALSGRSQKPQLQLIRDNKAESFGSKETQKVITEILGLDWRGFLTSFFARQQELNSLADLPPSLRREQLAGMMGIGRLDRALQSAKDDRKLIKQTVITLEKQLVRVELVPNRIKELSEHIKGFVQQKDTKSGACNEAKDKFATLEVLYREHQQKKSKCSQLDAALLGNRRTSEHLTQQLNYWKEQKNRLLEADLRLKELSIQLEPFLTIKQEFKTSNELKSRLLRKDELNSYLKERQLEMEKTNSELANLNKEEKELERSLLTYPLNLEQIIKKKAASLDAQRTGWTVRQAELKHLKLEISKINGQLEATSGMSPETVCDRCGRPYGSDLESIRKHLKLELSDLKVSESQKKISLDDSELKGNKLKNELNQLEKQAKEQNEIHIKKNTNSIRSDSFKKQSKTINENIQKLQKEIDTFGELSFDPARWDELKSSLKQLEDISKEAERLKGQIKELPATQTNITKSSEQLTKLKSEIEALKLQLKEIGFDQSEFDRITKEFTTVQAELQKTKDDLRDILNEIQIHEKELNLLKEELTRLQEISKELEENRSHQYYLEKLISLFTDFRRQTISRIRPQLAHLSGQLMSDMSGGRYSLVELDEDYNLRILDNGEYFGIERFSGGEKDLASLCLRLSISLALTESAGLEQSFIILDEVFSSQDSRRRELIFQALARLKERFPQMLLITHLEELKHKVEKLVELTPTKSGWSQVVVDGQKV